MNKGKAPGIDGLGVELFKKCPSLLEGVLDMWNHAVEVGELCQSARIGLLKLLFKKDDPSLITNYRPLTLGNSDYKLIAKAFAMRLAQVVHQVVSPNQSGFIPGRDIRNNVAEAHLTLKSLNR